MVVKYRLKTFPRTCYAAFFDISSLKPRNNRKEIGVVEYDRINDLKISCLYVRAINLLALMHHNSTVVAHITYAIGKFFHRETKLSILISACNHKMSSRLLHAIQNPTKTCVVEGLVVAHKRAVHVACYKFDVIHTSFSPLRAHILRNCLLFASSSIIYVFMCFAARI